MDLVALADQYKSELLENVLPFWEKHSRDQEQGGYFTCLLRDGTVFDTDKFIWLQARQVWLFSSLYERFEARSSWLEFALHGADFLEKHGRDQAGNWFFSLNKAGQPLVQPYNIFSDCFAAMAFGQLYKITKEKRYADIATTTFEHVLDRQENPKGQYHKSYPGTRPLKNFALPMILCNLCLELESLLQPDVVESTINTCIQEVMNVFYDENSGVIRENVYPDGRFSDSFEGRLLNPGHAIEAMWFIMDLAIRNQDELLAQKAAKRSLQMLEHGWDHQNGGIFYFMDSQGYPPQQLEWNQKLWWVHLETLIAMLKAYRLTRDEAYRQGFEKVHQYTWSHFPDPKFGEWFGYLNRDGKVLLDLKGGKWKGCFHVPRGLWRCWLELEQLKLDSK